MQMTAEQVQVSRQRVFVYALAFVLGFTVIFVIGWGGTATVLGQLFGTYKRTLAQIGGLVVILFGLHTLGWIQLPFLNYEMRLGDGEALWQRGPGLWSAFGMGVFFAAGWTPCVGTTLGAILTMALAEETVYQAMVLSAAYALGLGIPFLLLALGFERAERWMRRFRRHIRTFNVISGLLLIGIGVLLLTNRFFLIAVWAQKQGLYLDVPSSGTPNVLIAMAAGLLSFLSPCVFPLVPAYLSFLGAQSLPYQGA